MFGVIRDVAACLFVPFALIAWQQALVIRRQADLVSRQARHITAMRTAHGELVIAIHRRAAKAKPYVGPERRRIWRSAPTNILPTPPAVVEAARRRNRPCSRCGSAPESCECPDQMESETCEVPLAARKMWS